MRYSEISQDGKYITSHNINITYCNLSVIDFPQCTEVLTVNLTSSNSQRQQMSAHLRTFMKYSFQC